MKKVKNIIISIAILISTVIPLVPVASVAAVDVFPTCTSGATSGAVCGDTTKNGNDMIKSVINLLLYAIGIIAVIVIIIGGIRYTTSGGDANGIKGAKDTILYAVIGLIVALLAWAIVNFVTGWFI